MDLIRKPNVKSFEGEAFKWPFLELQSNRQACMQIKARKPGQIILLNGEKMGWEQPI